MNTSHERCDRIRKQIDRLEATASVLYGGCLHVLTAIEMQENGVRIDWPAVKNRLYMAIEQADSTD